MLVVHVSHTAAAAVCVRQAADVRAWHIVEPSFGEACTTNQLVGTPCDEEMLFWQGMSCAEAAAPAAVSGSDTIRRLQGAAVLWRVSCLRGSASVVLQRVRRQEGAAARHGLRCVIAAPNQMYDVRCACFGPAFVCLLIFFCVKIRLHRLAAGC